jgi:hypothetical protein
LRTPRSLRERQPTSMPARSPIANGPIGKPNSVSAPSDVLRQRAFEQELSRSIPARGQHAVADEAVADADHHRHLVDLAPDRHRGRRARPGAVVLAAHDLEQLHHVRGREEVHAEHVGHAAGHGAISSTLR